MRKNPAAVALGSMRTAKKAATSRANGKKGGRPKSPFRIRIIKQYAVQRVDTGADVETFKSRGEALAYLHSAQ